jgi:hypothetical protein
MKIKWNDSVGRPFTTVSGFEAPQRMRRSRRAKALSQPICYEGGRRLVADRLTESCPLFHAVHYPERNLPGLSDKTPEAA